MKKEKHSLKLYKNAREMDEALEETDLSAIMSAKGKVVKPKNKKINIDLPEEVIRMIDAIASKIGISRQPLIKMWLHEMIKKEM